MEAGKGPCCARDDACGCLGSGGGFNGKERAPKTRGIGAGAGRVAAGRAS